MAGPVPIKLFNTLTKNVEILQTLKPGRVGIYCCGPTVYDYQHIGNLRTYIFEDILTRTLRLAGYEVYHVMNITDVGHLVSDSDSGEDKMLVAARREKKKSFEIAEFYTNIFFDDCAKLNIKRPNVVCKATDHIPEMIELIKRVERNGFTYVRAGNVYFDITKLKDYGKLARLDLEKLMAGARIEVDQSKRNPLDFVLWFTKSKFADQELQWDSPWGRGYPGWHIECSAMAMKYLGDEFDIHCGGIDHVPVHHTNEIAQSEAATGKPWVRHWMHGEFLLMNKEKMAKSKGGFLTVGNLVEKGYDPLAYRMMCLGAHYRTQLSFGWEAMDGAVNALTKIRNAVLELRTAGKAEGSLSAEGQRYQNQFREAIFNDLNMPQALAVVWSALADKNLKSAEQLQLIYDFDEVLGLGLKTWVPATIEVPAKVQALAKQRETARAEKNWKEADRLRDEIKRHGFVVEDSAGGAVVKKI